MLPLHFRHILGEAASCIRAGAGRLEIGNDAVNLLWGQDGTIVPAGDMKCHACEVIKIEVAHALSPPVVSRAESNSARRTPPIGEVG